jgi:hypothetical protein
MTTAKNLPPVPTIRRGQITGKQTGGPPLTERTRWWKCEVCGGHFDMHDLGSVVEHDSDDPASHPVGDQVQ